MYWKDTDNILQDLSKFTALYVRFHQCAWTWNQRHNDEDEGVEENDYWYMGKIPSMQANVAFSLYGHLNGQGTFEGCNQLTFINSFYTTTGYTAFSKALYYAGVTGFSSSGVSYGAECQGGYGVGCDSSGGFAVHQYSTSVCNPANITATTNTLTSLNSAMKNVQCSQIYSRSRSYGSSSSSSSNGDDSTDDGYSTRSSTSLSLLDNSAACFYQNVYSPDGTCPDPYGKIAYYKETFYKEIQKAKAQRPTNIYRKEAQYNAEISHGQSNARRGILLLALAGLVLIVNLILVSLVLPTFTPKGKAVRARTAIQSESEHHSMTESGTENEMEYM
jgi:hypothetical protein